jgi:hypothetical protein
MESSKRLKSSEHPSLKKMSKHDIIDIVHKAKCMKLKGLKLDSMTKENIIDHLLKSKCPELRKILM